MNNISRYFKNKLQISKNINLAYLACCLILFYVSQFFIGGKPLYFLTIFATFPFFYLAVKNITFAVLLTLILSLFFEIGVAGRLFLLEPRFLNLGSGWWITPKTILALTLLILTVKNWKKLADLKIQLPDVMLALFLFWSVISFIFRINVNFLFGLISLFETVLIYYLLRLNLDRKIVGLVIIIFISVFFFQGIISAAQILLKRPLGLIIESVALKDPYSLATIEGGSLFRISGTYGHPNMLAAVLLSLTPFIIMTRPVALIFFAVDIFIFLLVFYTYSRITWFFFIFQYVLTISLNKTKNFTEGLLRHKYVFLFILIAGILIYFVTPKFLGRLQSTGFSLEEYGSLGLRVKLMQEALNLMAKNPLFGTGLHRSLEFYARNPVTDLFAASVPDPFYRIHNMFLEIGSETGIPGLIFFLLFIYFVFNSYISDGKQHLSQTGAVLGLAGLVIIAYLNPFFHTIVLDIILLLSALILA